MHVVVFILVHLEPKGKNSGGDLWPTTQGNKQRNTNQSCQQITIKANVNNYNNGDDNKSG